MNKAIKSGLLPIALFINSGLVNAAATGPYLGGGAGIGILENQQGLIKEHEGQLGGRVFLGYNFNRFLGIETNYSALGKTRYFDINYPSISADYTLNALSLVGKVYLPFSDDKLNIYGLFGAAQVYGDLDARYNARSFLTGTSKDIVPTAGFGASYDINQNLALGLELSGFGEIKTTDTRLGVPNSALATLSLAYKF